MILIGKEALQVLVAMCILIVIIELLGIVLLIIFGRKGGDKIGRFIDSDFSSDIRDGDCLESQKNRNLVSRKRKSI